MCVAAFADWHSSSRLRKKWRHSLRSCQQAKRRVLAYCAPKYPKPIVGAQKDMQQQLSLRAILDPQEQRICLDSGVTARRFIYLHTCMLSWDTMSNWSRIKRAPQPLTCRSSCRSSIFIYLRLVQYINSGFIIQIKCQTYVRLFKATTNRRGLSIFKCRKVHPQVLALPKILFGSLRIQNP